MEEALGMARAAVSEASAREARRLVEEGVKSESEAVKKLKEAAEKKGWKVSGERSGVSGTAPGTKEPVGSLPTPALKRSAHRSPLTAHQERTAAASSEVDLRGLTGDEAEAALVRAIDQAILGDLPHLRIIHGKGTGALRVRVGQLLKQDRRVRSFALAPTPQGGSGVTIAEFQP